MSTSPSTGMSMWGSKSYRCVFVLGDSMRWHWTARSKALPLLSIDAGLWWSGFLEGGLDDLSECIGSDRDSGIDHQRNLARRAPTCKLQLGGLILIDDVGDRVDPFPKGDGF